MTRRRIPLEDRLASRTSATREGAEGLLDDLRGRRSRTGEGDDQGEDASADTGEPDAFSRAIRERADAHRLGWDALTPDGDDAA